MRQLDLFGSFIDTPSQEEKPEENVAVAKKEEESTINGSATKNAYSKNTLRSERVSTKESSAGTNIKIDRVIDIEIQSAPAAPSLFTLFDAPATSVNPEAFSIEPDRNIVEQQEQTIESEAEQALTIIEQEQQLEPNDSSALVSEPAVEPIHENPPPAPSAEELVFKAVESKPRQSSAKQKKQKLPELERTGSVVFDDGKISVKIKNKSPFPAPAAKVKKEKAKKLPQKRGRKSFKEIDAEVDLIEIPEDEILFQKQYYAISEVAKWFRVNTSLLRFWENEFDVLKPRKNRKGDRLFRPEDVKNLQLIYQLLRQRKYTIEGAKEYIKTNKKKADIQLQLTNTLQKFKSFLLDMKATLQ